MMRVGKFGNALVNMKVYNQETSLPKHKRSMEEEHYIKENSDKESASQRRERENAESVGGLRDPRRAVARNPQLRATGATIRACLEGLLKDEVLTEFENVKDESPFPDELVIAAREALATAFNAEVCEEGYQIGLLEAMLHRANDPDATVLPSWLREGFPIGIARDIDYTGIFARTDGPSAAIKASQALQTMSDWRGDAQNYKSFEDAGDKARLN